jgi:hypothetical protein
MNMPFLTQAVRRVPISLAPAAWRDRIRVLAAAVVLFGVCAALLTFVQFGTSGLADNDGFYHIKMAQLIRAQGLTPPFIWLPMSVLGRQAFYDHHLLYHVYLALFVGTGDAPGMILGAKVASVIMPALACVAIWWLLRGQSVRWAWIWALGLFAISEAFLYRMSMPRAQAASLLALTLGLHWLLRRRYALLLPLGFVFVWLYNAFPLLLVLAVVYAAAALLVDRRLEWRALVYPAAGIVLGLVVNPYFPENFIFIARHLAPKIGAPEIPVGNEWYPYETWTLIENSGVALVAWVLGALGLGWRAQRIDRPTLAAFALSVFFGLLLFKARRFIEYFPPFALVFAALSLAPIVEGWAAGQARRRWLAPLLLCAALAVPLAITLPQARAAMAASRPADTYAAASRWLAAHSSPGSLVFQTDWDDFPRLFFYNSSNIYTIGLDPTYMQLYDADLYKEWVAITRGEVERPGARIRSRFGGAYVLSDLKHNAFLRQARNDPQLSEVYRDRYAVIFVVGQ